MLEYRYAKCELNVCAMVNFCAVIGCGKRANRDKDTSFYRLPAIITHQGEQTRQLSEKRRREWLAAIRRQDIKPENYEYTRVCSKHFIGRKPSPLYQTTHPDWVPSRCLGHNENKEASGGRYGGKYDLWPAETYIHFGFYLIYSPSLYTGEELFNYKSIESKKSFLRNAASHSRRLLAPNSSVCKPSLVTAPGIR